MQIYFFQKRPRWRGLSCIVENSLDYTPTTPSSRKITLTTSQDTQMKINPIPACSKILNPFLYFASSPAAVTIWNPPQSRIIKAINAKIPSIQLMKLFTTSISLPHWAVPVPEIPIPWVEVASPNEFCASVIVLDTPKIPSTSKDKIFADSFFIMCF